MPGKNSFKTSIDESLIMKARDMARGFGVLLCFFFVFITVSTPAQTSEQGVCIQGDCYNGTGVWLLADGKVFRGQFHQNRPHGYGTLYISEGNKLEGQWAKGTPSHDLVLRKGERTFPLELNRQGAWVIAGYSNDDGSSVNEDISLWSRQQSARNPDAGTESTPAPTQHSAKPEPKSLTTDQDRLLNTYLSPVLTAMVTDSLPPDIDIAQPRLAPSGINLFPFEQLFIEGTAKDETGIAWVRINGFDAEIYMPAQSNQVHFAASIGLRPRGTQQILIEASDPSGNVSRQTYMVRVDPEAEIDEAYVARKTRQSPPRIYVSEPVASAGAIEAPESFIDVRGYVVAFQGVESVFINGAAASLDHPGAVKTNFNARIPVFTGSNEITISAADRTGRRSSDSMTVDIAEAAGGNFMDNQGKNWLLAIGIDQYSTWRPLNNAVRDVMEMQAALIQKYRFEDDHIITLYNNEATLSNMVKALEEIEARSGPDDQVLVLFSGHGDYDAEAARGYWVPYDGHPDQRETYLSNARFHQYLNSWKARHVLVVADACFSGSLLSESRGFVNQVGRFKSRRALVSGRLEPVSDGILGTHSPFAEAVLSYLRQNTRPAFASSQLEQFVKISVANMHRQTPLNGVIVNTGDRGGEFIFRLR